MAALVTADVSESGYRYNDPAQDVNYGLLYFC